MPHFVDAPFFIFLFFERDTSAEATAMVRQLRDSRQVGGTPGHRRIFTGFDTNSSTCGCRSFGSRLPIFSRQFFDFSKLIFAHEFLTLFLRSSLFYEFFCIASVRRSSMCSWDTRSLLGPQKTGDIGKTKEKYVSHRRPREQGKEYVCKKLRLKSREIAVTKMNMKASFFFLNLFSDHYGVIGL